MQTGACTIKQQVVSAILHSESTENPKKKKNNQVNYNRGILSSSKDLIGLLGKPIHFLNGLFIHSSNKGSIHTAHHYILHNLCIDI